MTKKLTHRQGLIKHLNKIVYVINEDINYFFVKDTNTSPVEKILKKYIVLV